MRPGATGYGWQPNATSLCGASASALPPSFRSASSATNEPRICAGSPVGLRPDTSDFEKLRGIGLATTEEHHESLRREFPSMRSIAVLGKGVTSWQTLPADAPDFEEAALRACELIVAGDPRIGKVPKSRRRSKKPRPPGQREP